MSQPSRLFDFPYFQQKNSPLGVMMTSRVAGEWTSYSTDSFIDKMNAVSKGLLALGVRPGEKVALISHNNRCEWNIMDHGILQIGAIDVPIYPTMTEKDIAYILNHSESKYCFVSNDELFAKVSAIRQEVPSLLGVYTFERVAGAPHWSEVTDMGSGVEQSRVEDIKNSVKEDDLATLIYTSGTTGLPKGVMLTHRNITSNAIFSSERLPGLKPANSRALSFLPVCHIFERMLHYLYVYNGVTVFFAESLETIKEDLNYCKPHIFTAVPRLLEKFFDGIVAKGTSAGGLKGAIFKWAVGLALRWEPDGANGAFYEWQLGIARKLVFSKVKTALGLTEILAVASGSAALQPRLARFFNGADIPVLEGYGLTETSPVISVNTINTKGMIRIGAVGKPIRDTQVRIAADGEIQCKGPQVMIGYYKDPERTAEVLTDGWFSTGDIGVFEDGFLRITDRKKEIFKTSGGKYVAPQLIENALKESRFIEQCIVIGDGRNFPAALIVPAFDALKEWSSRQGLPWVDAKTAIREPKIIERIWQDINKTNETFGKWEQVKKIKLLPQLFTIEDGELTPTLKLKRKPIMERYAKEVEEIYANEA